MFSANRPVIDRAPIEWRYKQAVDLGTGPPGTILWAELIRGGIATHAFDNSQRLVDLPIMARGASGLSVQTPQAAGVAPPGWYMLFLVAQQHVPSAGTWIHLS